MRYSACEQRWPQADSATPPRTRAALRSLAGGRKAFVLGMLALSLTLTHPATGGATPTATNPSTPAAPARPNIVILVADDLGFTDLGSFGGEIATPRLDALAQQGVRFANFHTSASCSPTRAMLLTGVDNHRAGVGGLAETLPPEHRGQPGYQGSLNNRVVTIASLLRDHGYRTYASGKWNVGTEPANLPPQRGFDRSIVQGDTGSDNWDPMQRYLPHSARVLWFENGREPVMPKQFYSSSYFVDRVIEYIDADRASGKPFFALVGFQANHVPLQAPRELIDKYRDQYHQGWTALREQRRNRAAELGLIPQNTRMATMPTTADWSKLSDAERAYQARSMQVYAAMAEAMDQQIGRLVDHLKAQGELERTVFVFLSDNGPEGADYAAAKLWLMTQYNRDLERLGGPGAYAIPGPSWASATASPLAGYKFYGGEGAIRVPMFISAAGLKAGGIHHGLSHVTDIVPTLLQLAQVPAPGERYREQPIEPIAGRSLVPALHDPAASVRSEHDIVGFELSGAAALYQGRLKLSRPLPPIGDGQWHLYDIVADPGETQDLREQRPEDFQRLIKAYDVWARDHGVLPMPAGYDPVRQVLFNSFRNYWIPNYWLHGLGLTVLLLSVIGWRRRLRQRAPHKA